MLLDAKRQPRYIYNNRIIRDYLSHFASVKGTVIIIKNINDFDVFSANPITNFKNAGYYKHRPNWNWEFTADYAAFYCIESGEMSVHTADGDYLCGEGDVVFIKNFEFVRFANTASCDLSYYFISFFCERDFDFNINTVTNDAGAIKLFKSISEAHHSQSHLYKIKVGELLLRLIYTLASKDFKNTKDYIQNQKLLSVAEYINVNYYKKPTPAYLAKISGYSPAHLRRLFIKNFGMPPTEYILHKKIDMAKEILTDAPEKTVEEIADLVGICSASYLCSSFKKITGLSPGEFKQKAMLKNKDE